MSYSKALEAYPPEFAQLIEHGALQGVSLPLPSEEEARRLMGRLYAFKGVVKKEAHGREPSEEIKALYALSNKCQIRVTGCMLTLRPLDQDPDALLIRAALEQAGPAGPTTTTRSDGQILVPINPVHLPPWLADMAIERAKKPE
jgi:hypothetical protein